MKPSKYNYYIEIGQDTVCFNGLYRNHFKINTELSKKVINSFEDMKIIEENSPAFYNSLIENHFIIEEDIDEIDVFRNVFKQSVDSKQYLLIILPTMSCNFSCWYCVQNHIPSIMNNGTIEKIKKHISYMIEKEKISSLHIEWFGGEPFMYFNQVIKPISEHAINVCSVNSIPFINTATTNGYLLKQEIRNELIALRFVKFQVTIDGVRSVHNKIKNASDGCSAFDVALKNINATLKLSKDIKLTLRINYDYENLNYQIFEEINELIDKDTRDQIEVMLRRIWQVKYDKEKSEKLTSFIKYIIKSDYQLSRLDLNENYLPCYVNKKYYISINYNGFVVKCTSNDDLQSIEPNGMILDDGTVKWKDGFLSKFENSWNLNKTCIECKYLPLCCGNCYKIYNEQDSNGFKCKQRNIDITFEKLILQHFYND